MSGFITRRTVLAGGTASLLAAPWVARAEAKTLRIGVQSILSGPIALLGNSSRNALMIELDRINAAGGFLGLRSSRAALFSGCAVLVRREP